MNNYILTYNPAENFPTEGQLQNHIKVNRHIQQYYQPYIGTYFIKSGENRQILQESLRGFFENAIFFVTPFEALHSNGSLPTEIWNWIAYGTYQTQQYGVVADALKSLRSLGQSE